MAIDAREDLAPAWLKRQRELEAQVLNGTQATKSVKEVTMQSGEDIEVPRQTTPEPSTKPTATVADLLFSSRTAGTVELILPSATLRFKAVAADIGKYSIGFLLKADTFIEPTVMEQVVAKFKGKTYNTVYVGGSFRFKEAGYNLLTFLLKDDEDEDTR